MFLEYGIVTQLLVCWYVLEIMMKGYIELQSSNQSVKNGILCIHPMSLFNWWSIILNKWKIKHILYIFQQETEKYHQEWCLNLTHHVSQATYAPRTAINTKNRVYFTHRVFRWFKHHRLQLTPRIAFTLHTVLVRWFKHHRLPLTPLIVSDLLSPAVYIPAIYLLVPWDFHSLMEPFEQDDCDVSA